MSVPESDDQPHTRTRMPEGLAGGPGRPARGLTGPEAPAAAWRRLRMLGAVFVLVFVLVVALAIFNRTGGTTSRPNGGTGTAPAAGSNDGRADATAPTGTAPVTGTTNGIATGYARTEQGAESAAANYAVALGSSDMFKAASRHAIIATVYAPSAQPAVLSRTDSQYQGVNDQLGLKDGAPPAGLTLVARTLLAGARLDSYTSDAATVSIWADQLGGLAGSGSKAPVTEIWNTVTLHLQWTSGDWKVLSLSSTDGPAPIGSSQRVADPNALSTALSQFGGFRYAR